MAGSGFLRLWNIPEEWRGERRGRVEGKGGGEERVWWRGEGHAKPANQELSLISCSEEKEGVDSIFRV